MIFYKLQVKWWLILVFYFCVEVENANILAVFPVSSKTRQLIFRPLLNKLAKRGHEIFLVTPYSNDGANNPNITEFNKKDVAFIGDGINLVNFDVDAESQNMTLQFIEQIKSPVVSNALRQSQFDLLIADADVRSILVLSHIYDVPVIQMSVSGSAFGNFKIIGAPNNHLFYSPNQYRKNPSIWEVLTSIYSYNSKEIAFNTFEKVENDLLKKNFGPNIPELSELYDSVHMLFLNVHSVWDANRPVPSSVLYLGGLHLDAKNSLPQELKRYLDSSVNGVIYISFGSRIKISHLKKEVVKTMIEVLSDLPYDVVVKADSGELFELPKNIKTLTWIPQQDFLKHPKILLFVNQGGLLSTYEAVDSIVPLICIPFINDQRYNSDKVVEYKVGLKLEYNNIKKESFRNAINTVIRNKSYKENLVKLRTILHDQPETPLQRAVWWTEHVIRHSGARHLRSPAANMPWSQYLELELIGYVILALTVFAIVFVSTMYICFKSVFRTRKYKLP